MECSTRRLSVIFCATVFITTVFLLTSFHELPRSIFHRVFKDSFGNVSLLYNADSTDTWGRGDSAGRLEARWKAPPMPKRTNYLVSHKGKVITKFSGLSTQRAFNGDKVHTGHVSTLPTEGLTRTSHLDRKPVLTGNFKIFSSKTLKPWSYSITKDVSASFTGVTGTRNISGSPLQVNIFSKRFPDAIIIGVKKGGTRALLQFLSIHSRVKIAKKEIHFFDKDFNYGKGLSWYKDQMPLAFRNETVMEKTPGYFVAKLAPKRIYEMNPSVKLIVTFRDPTRRSVSDYAQSLDKAATRGRRKHVKPFTYKMFLDEKRKILNRNNSKVSIGMYAVHLKRWLDVFPRKQMHFVSGENLVKRPWEELYTVQKFLNLPTEITKADFVLNETKGFYCLRWKKNKKGGVKDGHCLNEGKGRKHPYVAMKTIRTLQDFFRPLNNELYKLTGRNFHWP